MAMARHEYASFSDRQVETVLRSVEHHEREGWELVTILRAPPTFWSGIYPGLMAIMRRPIQGGQAGVVLPAPPPRAS
jgi:hypothetical protein